MAVTKLYNLEGKATGELELDDKLFAVSAKPALLYQAVKVLRSRQRQPLAHTKDRGEVRGGGRKPWKQKGTGRARHGSIRSPLWRGGGVTFGPRQENITALSILKKMSRRALLSALGAKLRADNFYVIDDVKIAKASTKVAQKLARQLKIYASKILFIAAGPDESGFKLSLRNMPQTKSINLDNINLLDLLSYKNLLMSKAAVAKMTKIFS